MTIGDFVDRVLAIQNADQARGFFNGYVCGLAEGVVNVQKAEERARADIGWCFGEGMARERMQMWRETVGAEHPAGKIEDMTHEQLLKAGKKLARGFSRRLKVLAGKARR